MRTSSSNLSAQDKADILKRLWNKAEYFSAVELNVLGWKIAFPYQGNDSDYVRVVDEIYNDLKTNGWEPEEIKEAMIRPSKWYAGF